MSTDIVVVGSLNHDLTVVTPRHPRPGETVLGTRHYSDNGGKGANQAVAAARLGVDVALVGRVGDDAHGAALRSALANEGIDTAGITVDPEAPTGLAVITVDNTAENTIVVSPGANAQVGPTDIDKHRDLFADAVVSLAQLEVPVPAVLAASVASSGIFCLNPAPAMDLPSELLERVDVLIPNRGELATLAGVAQPASTDEVVAAVARLELDAAVAVTLGVDGALLVVDAKATHIPAPVVDAVDPTGAGDAFCGALAHALSQGLGLGDATKRAVIAGALATTRPGAQTAMPDRDEVELMLAR